MNLRKLGRVVRPLAFSLVILLSSNGCGDELEEQDHTAASQDIPQNDHLYQFITAGLGFDPADLVDYGDRYVAEGDIAFPKNSYVIPEGFASSLESDTSHAGPPQVDAGKPNGRTKQWIADYNSRVAPSRQKVIRVRINSNIPTSGKYNIRPNIEEAIQKWNAISCSEIGFEITTGNNWHIDIKDDTSLPSKPGLVLGHTDFPSDGFPGATIRLNVDQLVDNQFAEPKRTGIIMHEIGHAMGFRHTDWDEFGEAQLDAVLIPQTPSSDDQSVFNWGIPSLNDFTAADICAVQNVYPLFSDNDSPCRIPLYYYWSSTLRDAFLAGRLDEKNGPDWNYTLQRLECFVYSHPVEFTTIPLHRHYHASNKDHAFSTSANMGRGWRWDGTFYISPFPGTGRIALHEHYSSSNKDYFYTISSGTFRGYQYMGIIGYVWTSRQ